MDIVSISIEVARTISRALADKTHKERVDIFIGCYTGDFDHWALMASMVVVFSVKDHDPQQNHTSVALAAIEAAHAIGAGKKAP